MARIKISEHKAKSILLGDNYKGICINESSNISDIFKNLNITETYVLKVDQGEKKRYKRGLIKVSIAYEEILPALNELKQKGFSQFLIEEYIDHSSEMYLSFDRTREGIKVLFSNQGGVDIESSKENLQEFLIKSHSDISDISQSTRIESDFLQNLYEKFQENYFSFMEINPLVFAGGKYIMLDCAVMVDGAAKFNVSSWNENDFIKDKSKTEEEIAVANLDANTPASLKLQVLNPNGSIGMLLSSGGASIVIADEVYSKGKGNEIINYGEYSGGPTREETYQYSKNILQLLIKSNSNNKTLLIAGGVANFTDIYETFKGIIDAISEVKNILKEQNIKVFVRRGGPNELKGLKIMKDFLEENGLLGSVYGSETSLVKIIDDLN